MLNHLVVLTSGYAAEAGNKPCLAAEPAQNRIWSQGTASAQEGWLSKDYYQVNGFAVGSAFEEPSCTGTVASTVPTNMGVITHEHLHGFGLYDMYDQDKDETQKIVIGGTGRFDIMSNAHGWNGNTKIPGQMAAFSRLKVAGWLEPILIETDGFYAIQPSEISSHVYKISHNFPDGEYLLIENRQPVKWDENWPYSGIVIYHIDEKEFKQTKRGYPGKPGWPADHYMVSVIQADGLYDIEKGVNLGDAGDFWVKGKVLAPGPTFPNTDSIQGGVQKPTGLTITIRSDPGFIMSFQVEGISGNRAGRFPSLEKSGVGNILDPDQQPDPDTAGDTLAWILSMIGGIAAMLGILVLVL